jgi:hypothetical protein
MFRIPERLDAASRSQPAIIAWMVALFVGVLLAAAGGPLTIVGAVLLGVLMLAGLGMWA